jgi:hypothetical protein
VQSRNSIAIKQLLYNILRNSEIIGVWCVRYGLLHSWSPGSLMGSWFAAVIQHVRGRRASEWLADDVGGLDFVCFVSLDVNRGCGSNKKV